MKYIFVVGAMAMAGLVFCPQGVRAGLTAPGSTAAPAGSAANSMLCQVKVYQVPESRVVGQCCVREGVTVWECTAGTWNGQSLGGLSLVLVNNPTSKSEVPCARRCYVSHGATPDQRAALLNAYLTSQAVSPGEATQWHVEPAVIRLEIAGRVVFVHLGLVA
jgi:hypothetical protein